MGAADFDNIVEGQGFIIKRLLQNVELRDQLYPKRNHRRYVHRRRENVVRALALVNIIVRMHLTLHPAYPAQQFTRTISQHLIHIHVALRTGAGLPDCQRKLVRMLACQHFIRSLNNHLRFFCAQKTEIVIHLCRRTLGQRQRMNKLDRHFFRRDAEMFQRALSLRAPKPIGRHIDCAHRVFFTAMRCHYFLLGFKVRNSDKAHLLKA